MKRDTAFFKLVFMESDLINQAEIHCRHDGTFHRLTPGFTASELDGYINLLITGLEQLRHEGKAQFAATKNKPVAW